MWNRIFLAGGLTLAVGYPALTQNMVIRIYGPIEKNGHKPVDIGDRPIKPIAE